MSNKKLVGVLCADDSDSLSECEEFYPECLLEKLPWGSSSHTPLTKEELKMKRSYSYDPEPVKAWIEITDYMAIKECNEGLWSEISTRIGKYHGYRNSLFLYRDRHSEVVNVIERILCQRKCYYFPKNCLFKHGYDFRNLLHKKLHQSFSPTFESLFRKDAHKTVELERFKNGRPNMIKLADDIGITTELDYDENGFLKVDMSVFHEFYWNEERPCFVKEEKKVLDTVYALLLSSSSKQDEEMMLATKTYSQTVPGINDPVLKVMSYGPDLSFHGYNTSEGVCDMTEDENNADKTCNVEHTECSYFERKKHWTYVHFEDGESLEGSQCDNKENLVLEGPASSKDASISYPCNLKHCWRCCLCTFCQLARNVNCDDHKNHILYNIRQCEIQKLAQCQDHWLDHPENFNSKEDIIVKKKILFHNDELKIYGRNYSFKTVKYAGLKLPCKKCKKNTKEHLNEHLTPHMQCKHCIYEMKTLKELSFWRRVCAICGKILNDETAKMQHQKKHEVEVPECDVCDEKFSTIYNLHRHMQEQHNSFQGEKVSTKPTANEQFVCEVCFKPFNYKRNLNMHICISHTGMNELKCPVCEQKFGTRSNLKRHLMEQHKITQFDSSIHPDEVKVFTCMVCDSVFKRKQHLKEHEMTHVDSEKFTCDQCGKQFSVKSSLVRHQKIHTGEREKHPCEVCRKIFLSKGSLGRHMEGIHR